MQISAISPVSPSRLVTSSPVRPSSESDNKPKPIDSAPRQLQPARVIEQNAALLNQLVAIDRRVRAHEAAHAAVGGRFTGSPSYSYQRGPNGNLYAVGGSVPIDTKPIPGDPEATIEKAAIIQRAALAPSQPSAQDKAVAAQAAQMAIKAQAEIESSDRQSQGPNQQNSILQYQQIQDIH